MKSRLIVVCIVVAILSYLLYISACFSTAPTQIPSVNEGGQAQSSEPGNGKVKLEPEPQKHEGKTSGKIDIIATELLGRPTDRSVTVNTIANQDLEVFFEYGTESGIYSGQTSITNYQGRNPIEVVIDQLQPNTRYHYRIRYRQPGESAFIAGEEHTFYTQRLPGSTFTFTIQADSHLGTEKHCNPDLYKRTLLNALNDKPDFHIDLGDTFRATKLKVIDYQEVVKLYLNQRQYFGLLCHSAPLFLVTGNHEAAFGWELDGTHDNIAILATKARKLYYLNPLPDEFYTGNTDDVEFIGLPENYYAWEWGDALFVVLDPYWYTTTNPKESRDMWDWTLGDQQYTWFKQVLESSNSKHKFVFAHHVLGETRGAIEWARYYEWGGENKNGSWEFDGRRPGWDLPIHQLMVKSNVTVFFQGHDHLFAKQELDGVIYQEVPMPADPTYSTYNQDAYRSGISLPNSGHLRVTVSPSDVRVDYVRAYLPDDDKAGRRNGEVAYSYTISRE